MPLVSVVVTYFKKKKYILRCLKSISAQTFRNFEIILVYDDNDKEEFQYIKDLKKKFKNLIVYKNKKNLGAGESKNIGVKRVMDYFSKYFPSSADLNKACNPNGKLAID